MTRLTTAIRFPQELHQQLVAAADERELSVNQLVIMACRDYLPRLVPADEIKWTRP